MVIYTGFVGVEDSKDINMLDLDFLYLYVFLDSLGVKKGEINFCKEMLIKLIASCRNTQLERSEDNSFSRAEGRIK